MLRAFASRHARTMRQLTLGLILCVFAGKALIPSGYMLGQNDDGMVVQMCGGGEPSFLRIDLSAGKAEILHEAPADAPHNAPDGMDSTCPFAFAPHALADARAASLPPPARAPPEKPPLPLRASPQLVKFGAPIPARGPPLHL